MKRIGRLEKPDNKRTAKIFENPFLEKFTRTSIGIPLALFYGHR